MKKTIILFIALLLSFQWVAAQSVSDEQVIKIVMAEKEKGCDEKTIAQKLLRRGVTPAQLRRIKAKYEQEQNGVGAVDVTGVNRNRGNERQGGEFMLRDERNLNNKQKLEMVQEGMGFLDIDSVAYYSNLLNKDEVYGRNLFNNELLTFEPAMNIPTPVDYVLGPGDQVIIDIWGASQQNIEGVISPDGYIVVEGVGPVNFSGLTVAEAIEHARNMLGEYYSGSSITLSLGATRSVKVEIVGDVVAPGSYTLSAFSTLFNALYMAGGISDMGTLRDIKVFRNGKQVSKIDVYDYIINGNNKGNIRLQDNDLVVVGPYDTVFFIVNSIFNTVVRVLDIAGTAKAGRPDNEISVTDFHNGRRGPEIHRACCSAGGDVECIGVIRGGLKGCELHKSRKHSTKHHGRQQKR